MGNNRGPWMDPCGTPQESEALEEEALPLATEKDRLDRYDQNQSSATSEIQTFHSNTMVHCIKR